MRSKRTARDFLFAPNKPKSGYQPLSAHNKKLPPKACGPKTPRSAIGFAEFLAFHQMGLYHWA